RLANSCPDLPLADQTPHCGPTSKFREHVNTLLLQQVLAEPAWAKKLSDEDRRGLTALFWSNINPYGTFRLDMDRQLDLGSSATVPGPRRPRAGTSTVVPSHSRVRRP
ncbi:Tn3 family transposase, partial [Streptomyces sp. NPDC005989]|uniref:Tn3 family transposase n=1 Tax=Streptomyces sp. NPDC005989 TaxID=3156727 RepID=UPI0033FBAD4E